MKYYKIISELICVPSLTPCVAKTFHPWGILRHVASHSAMKSFAKSDVVGKTAQLSHNNTYIIPPHTHTILSKFLSYPRFVENVMPKSREGNGSVCPRRFQPKKPKCWRLRMAGQIKYKTREMAKKELTHNCWLSLHARHMSIAPSF